MKLHDLTTSKKNNKTLMKVLLKSTQIIDQILPKTLKSARKWTLIKDTNVQIQLLEKWGKVPEDGLRKNTKSFFRG